MKSCSAAIARGRDMAAMPKSAGVRGEARNWPTGVRLSIAASMAWRLLNHRYLETTVYRSLLSALIVYAIGCVVPTPLEADTTMANFPPTIIKGEPLEFGVITEDAADKNGWFLGVVAADPDPTDTLSARLYWKNGDEYFRLAEDIVLNPTTGLTPNDTTRHEGTFALFPYCALIGNGPNQLIYAYVSDYLYPQTFGPPKGFPDLGSQPTSLLPGHFDSKFWVVTCK